MTVQAIGTVRCSHRAPQPDELKTVSEVVIDRRLTGALEGLEGFSHIIVVYWMHKLPPEEPALKIHPMGKKEFPLVGLFVTRSPHRPTPIGITVVKLVERRKNVLVVEGLDAFDGSPVIDVKPYIPGYFPGEDVRIPSWMTQAFQISLKLKDIYRRLLERYGPQHWWPAESDFEMIAGAILTQSTAWTNVEKAIANLKGAGVMSPKSLRDMPPDDIAELIRPCGYYNAKAKKLKAFAAWLGENYNDDLERLWAVDASQLRRELLSVHGIGEETADSIILYGAKKPVFVIDAYTRRIVDRLGLTPGEGSYGTYQSLFRHGTPTDAGLFGEYHALLVRLAKEVCRPTPRCLLCCLKDICPTGGK